MDAYQKQNDEHVLYMFFPNSKDMRVLFAFNNLPHIISADMTMF
jgi:hypothetical protein